MMLLGHEEKDNMMDKRKRWNKIKENGGEEIKVRKKYRNGRTGVRELF
jgi:hypothetical protein